MKCPKCSTENPEGLTLCGQCGAKLERICPNCNFTNPFHFKFCSECGHKLILPLGPASKELSLDDKIARIQRYLPEGLTARILSQRGKIEGEKKHVTIMFCDMSGFTQLTEKLGPEETFSLMDQISETLIHKVNEYHGTVNEIRGDAILALFGAPIALEDAPQRAIQSALAIHQEMIRLNENLGDNSKVPPILFRIGINTGPVVVGTVGNDLRVQFAAVGDTINMAARMENLAEPGTTYVTEETYRLTKDLFQFQTLGKKVVKGKEGSISVYKVLSGKENVYRPRLGSERMIYSEMVGRDNELHKLELQVMKAINGQGSVVNIIGEAGIGKSRLVAELKKRETMKAVKLLEGRAISIGGNLSFHRFHPITDLLKQWMGIRQDDDQVAALSKLQDALRNLFPEEFGEMLPFVATLMGIPLSGKYAEVVKGLEGEALEKLILKSLRDLLIRAAGRTPLMIVMEDLHWADTSSLELLESLFRLAENQRILFINLFRPGFPETGDRILKTLKERFPVYHLEMVLDPLDERMSEALIGNMLNTW